MSLSTREVIRAHVAESLAVKERFFAEQEDVLAAIAVRLESVLRAQGTIYLCGNGGSAADAQHVAAEFVGRFRRERQPLPAVALTTNTSVLTAIANDYDFSEVFARQIKASVREQDAVVGISTSGRSANVLKALEAATQVGAYTLAFTGSPGEPLSVAAKDALQIPSTNTGYIQEAHIMAWHIICDLIEHTFATPLAAHGVVGRAE